MRRQHASPMPAFTFTDLARQASVALGSPWAFASACGLILAWGLTGAFFNFSDAWQLVINTGTTIVTFLMVFLIQSTQNRDAKALHLKLDELIRSTTTARNRLIDLEHCTERELDDLQQEFERVRRRGRRHANDARQGPAPLAADAAPGHDQDAVGGGTGARMKR